MTKIPPEKILVVVHPGSACGSANYNIGFALADAGRRAISAQLNDWSGRVIIVDAELSDEIANYGYFSNAIVGAVARNPGSIRICGSDSSSDPDDSLDTVIERLFSDHPELRDFDHHYSVTGCWASRGDSGCVNAVVESLDEAGCNARLAWETAIFEDEPELEPEPEPDHAIR